MARRGPVPSGRGRILPAIVASVGALAMLAGPAVALPIGAFGSGPPPAAGPLHLGKLHWIQVATTAAPAGRNWVSMAYDLAAGYVVLHGGYDPNGPVFYNDTWTYSAGRWSNLSARAGVGGPSAPTGLTLVYDPTLHGVVTFGGEAPYGSAYYNDTWLIRGGGWKQLHPTVSPPGRSQYAMAYDGYYHRLVLFGGVNGTAVLNDTWSFNGTTWVNVSPPRAPPPTEFGRMVYDRTTGAVLLVGGMDASTGTYSTATWGFKAGTWVIVPGSSTTTPIRTFEYLSTLRNGTPLLFGGQAPGVARSNYNTTWEFFGLAWHQMRTTTPPSARNNGAFTYDAADGYDLLFGGTIGSGSGVYYSDTWTLRP